MNNEQYLVNNKQYLVNNEQYLVNLIVKEPEWRCQTLHQVCILRGGLGGYACSLHEYVGSEVAWTPVQQIIIITINS